MEPQKQRYAGKFKLESHDATFEDVLKVQGESWVLIKAIRHVPKTKSLTVEQNLVKDDVVAAGLIHLQADHPIVPTENARQITPAVLCIRCAILGTDPDFAVIRQHALEKGLPSSLNGRKCVSASWWEDGCLVLFNHEAKTGMDMYIRHALSEDGATLTCTLKVEKGGKTASTVDTWRRV